MPWITQTDVENAITEQMLIKLTADVASPTEVDTDKFEACRNLAEGIIASKLANRYPSQVSDRTTDESIKEISLMFTLRNLINRRPGWPVDKDMADRISEAMDLLNSFAHGDMDVAEWASDDSIELVELEYPPDTGSLTDFLANRTEADF